MKVKELIETLKGFEPDEEVYISSDEEGNNILKIYEVAIYSEETDATTPIVIFPSHERLEE